MDFARLAALASGHAEARILQVALGLKIFDRLEHGTKTAGSMAAELGSDPRATELFLNAMVALGLLSKKREEFNLTEISRRYLTSASPEYFGSMVLFDASLWNCWGYLEEAVRSGKPARPPDMYQGNNVETERFILAMDSLVRARGDAEVVTQMLDLRGVREILDVGAGPATYAIELCRKNPKVRATLFDLPNTLQITRRFVEAAGLKERIRLVAGDYRQDVIPGDYGFIFLSNIIHSEGEEENRALIRKLYGCLEARGRIVIKDHILDESLTRPVPGAVFSLLMLLTTRQGRCYSLDEIKGWLVDAGLFSVEEIVLPAPLTSSLVVASKN